jgi:fatty-acyl-CoA synthase
MSAAAYAHLSFVRGSDEPPLLEQTVGEVLRQAAASWPNAEALVSIQQGVRWSYAEFLSRVERLAAGLLKLGLRHGDRVGIWSPNNAEWTVVQFATGLVGIVLVNINPAYRTAELEYTLNKVAVKALIAAREFKTSHYLEMLEALAPEIVASEPGQLGAQRLPHLRWVVQIARESRPGWLNFDDLYDSEVSTARGAAKAVACDQPINIQFTSGTTGHPKGATLSHRNIVNNAHFVGRAVGLSAGDRLCIPVPLYHCFGMVLANLACVVRGATMVYPSAGFDAAAVLHAVHTERCTALYGVPTMFIAELEHPRFSEFDLSSLRYGIMSGAPCPTEVMRRVMDRMHMRDITIAYGMTETSPVSFQSSREDSLEHRVATVGRIQPHLECKLIDAAGEIVPRGVAGEICIRGYSVMLGYWDDAARTAQAIDAEGWMHTGDLGQLDPDGYARIIGRNSDMIIRGGENIYPREVEDFLLRHPHIADVAVIGVPDERLGEEVCAWVKRRAGGQCDAGDIKRYCQGQIAHYKAPRYVLFVEEFPTTVTGKVRKNVMREESLRRLGLAVHENGKIAQSP